MRLAYINYSMVSICLTTAVVAANEHSSFKVDGEVAGKLNYNSALTVDELDDVSSDGDSGHELSAKINGNWHISNKAKLQSSYSIQQQSYQNTSRYDLDLHQLSLDGSYQFDQVRLGLRLDGVRAHLIQQRFLDFQQASLYGGTFLQPQTFLRSSVEVNNKSFAQSNERDAQAVGGTVSIFHFMNNAQTMLMFGVNAEQEEAKDEQYNYFGMGMTSKLTHRFQMFGVDAKAGIGWRYTNRDYQQVDADELADDLTGSTTMDRDEHRHVVSLNLDIKLLESLTLVTELEHGDYQSTLDSQTYQQNKASVGLSYAF